MSYGTAQRILKRGNRVDSKHLKICSSSLAIRANRTQNYFNILLFSYQSDHKQEYKCQKYILSWIWGNGKLSFRFGENKRKVQAYEEQSEHPSSIRVDLP